MSPRQLLVIRHAKSGYPEGVADFDRPLADRGMRAAGALGAWLADEELMPELILVSAAQRTTSTAQLLVESAVQHGAVAPEVRYLPELYDTSVHQVLHVVAEVAPELTRVAVVGHEPTVSSTVAALTGRHVAYPTACVCVVEVPGSWGDLQQGVATLARQWIPRQGEV